MNSLQKAYLTIYGSQLNEGMSEDEKEMRRLAAQERRAGNSDRMDAKVAKKYADSEARSASREDKKSKGKHIHGMADSFEPEGEEIDEVSSHLALTASQKADEMRRKAAVAGDTETAAAKAAQASRLYKGVGPRKARERAQAAESAVPGRPADRLVTDRAGYRIPEKDAEEARQRIKAKMAVRKKGMKEEIELDERALDPTETAEKERIVKGMKKSAKAFKERYGKRAKSVMYATATARAKERMDTSKSDRRYGVER